MTSMRRGTFHKAGRPVLFGYMPIPLRPGRLMPGGVLVAAGLLAVVLSACALFLPVSVSVADDRAPGAYETAGPDAGRDPMGEPGNGEAIEQSEQFRSLPPEKQRRVRENLRKYQSLSPEEKARLNERMERFKSLPPEKRERLKNKYDKWNKMSPDERKEMRERSRKFRELTPEKRDYIRGRIKDIRKLPPDKRRPQREELRRELKKEGIELPRRHDRRRDDGSFERDRRDGRKSRPEGRLKERGEGKIPRSEGRWRERTPDGSGERGPGAQRPGREDDARPYDEGGGLDDMGKER